MTEQDEPQFIKILTVFAEIFDKKLSTLALDMYFKALATLTIEEFEKAAEHLLQTKTFNKFPLPGEFLQLLHPTLGADDKAIIAMDYVFDVMEGVGVYETVEFDDPVIHHIINHWGGWVAFCETRRHQLTDTEDRFWQREFIQLYNTYSRRRSIEAPPRAVGITECTNVQLGYENWAEHEPIRITDKDRPKELPDGTERGSNAEKEAS